MDALTDKQLLMKIIDIFTDTYWNPLRDFLTKYPEYLRTFPAFILNPEHIVVYMTKDFLAIEYFGNEGLKKNITPDTIGVTFFNYSSNPQTDLLEEITGIDNSSITSKVILNIPLYSEDMVVPTNEAFDILIDLGWNFMAENAFFTINRPIFHFEKNNYTRIINGRFYDVKENSLKTRHIKWLDVIPINVLDKGDELDISLDLEFYHKIIEIDASYMYPLPPKEDYKLNKLPQLNRFIEFISDKNNNEPQITNFLNMPENRFILTMGFFGKYIYCQKSCQWQSEDKKNIIPDFFIEKPNGYSDIIEFKLPHLKSQSIVGRENRETFSAEIHSYISQTRVYNNYFHDPNNREWVLNTHGIRVHNPKRILVIGRRWHFSNEEWREIQADFQNLEIMTYDDLIDGVTAQFYM
ncbi:Shedu anti-phage system protein SduA domain-containing protein [Chryseobacterium sp.]|jgi:hypothetical protein|uniref:Shedu anti-phage system protein SduA domain-containing protein n=1 Tax=Chryseobacterium sp. TaxID=1871047 RepID=UPI002840F4F4|nr:Shedu anti-phage system protein SduA domain-containing protein [Chryseobacterium sp.]MDR3022572.1 DUF4263 domain-containing protein [Chryseobacterium sp.]